MNLNKFFKKLLIIISVFFILSSCVGLTEADTLQNSILSDSSIGSISINSADTQKAGDIDISGKYTYNPYDYPDMINFNMKYISISLSSTSQNASFTIQGSNYQYETTFNDIPEGTYDVTVSACYDYSIDGEGWYRDCITSTSQNLRVDGTTPNAVAKASPTPVIPNNDIQFSSSDSTGTGPADVYYKWNFGDRSSSNAANPTHKYSATGTYTVNLWVNESINGHTSSDTIDIKVVDSLPPSINIDSPEEGSTISMDPLEITWSGNDQKGIDYYNIILDNGDKMKVDASENSYSYDAVSDGDHTVEVIAHNLDGLSSNDYTNFTLDTSVKKPEINNPVQDDWLDQDEITIDWECEEPNIDHYEILKDSESYIDVGKQSSYTFDNLDEGFHYVKVKAVDTLNNERVSDRCDFNIDLSSPNIEINSPSENNWVRGDIIKIKWDGEDDKSGVDFYKINIDGQEWNEIGNVEEYEDSFLEGSHSVKVKIIDNVGRSNIDEVNFKVDSSSPDIQFKNLIEDSIIENRTVKINWSGKDNLSDIDNYEINIDNNGWTDVGLDTIKNVTLNEGEHYIKIRAFDSVRNNKTDEVNITVDTSKPNIDIYNPLNNSYFSINKILIRWEGNDEGTGIEHYEIKIDDGPWFDLGRDQYYENNFSIGSHEVMIKGFDGTNRSNTDSVNFTIDTVKPSIDIVSPSNNSHLSNGNFTLKWNVTDNISGIKNIDIKVDDNDWISKGLKETCILNLSDGAHEIYVKSIDKAMNDNTTSITVLIDSTAPDLLIQSPSNNSIKRNENVTIKWESYDNITDIDHFEIKIDNQMWTEIGLNNTYKHNFSDGHHSIKVKSFDILGNYRVENVDFYVDLYSPDVQIKKPTNNSAINKSNITVRWTGSDNSSGITHYEIKLNNASFDNVGTNHSLNYNLTDGEYSLYVKAVDKAGYVTIKVSNFTIDTVKPKLNITEPKKEMLVDRDPIRFKWTGIDEGSGINRYMIRLGEDDWQNIGLNTSYTRSIADGDHTFIVRAYDKAHNSMILSKNFTVENNPPSISTISPNEGDIIQHSNVTIKWNGSDNGTKVERYELSIDGKQWINTDKNTTYKGSFKNGYHDVRIKAYDSFQHSSIYYLNFTVDTKSPHVSIEKPLDGSYHSKNKFKVKWKSSDILGSGIDYHEVKVDDGDWEKIGSENYYYVKFSEGKHNLKIKAYDKIGLYSVDEVNFTVDSISPSVEIVNIDEGEIIKSEKVDVELKGEDQGSGISYYCIRKNDKKWQNIGSEESYKINFDDGRNKLTVKAVDRANNSVKDEINFTVDIEKPEIEIKKPNDESYHDKNLVHIEWTANDSGSGVKEYQVKIDNDSWIVVNKNYYETNLLEGKHEISVKAIDGCGGFSFDNITFTVDKSRPNLTIISPLNSSVSPSKNITIQWACKDEHSGIKTYFVKLNEDEWIDIGLKNQYEMILKEGSNNISLKAVDLTGNIEIESTKVIVNTDNPSFDFNINEDGRWTSNRSIEININLKENVSEITSMRAGIFDINNSNWTNFESTSRLTLPKEEGKHTIYVQLKDKFGRCSDIESRVIIFDETEPNGSINVLNKKVGDRSIELIVECSDPYESINNVLIGSNENLSNADLYDYQTNLSYKLNQKHGYHKLFYRFISEHGQKSSIYNTSVLLDIKGPELSYNGKSVIIDQENLEGNLSLYSRDDSRISHYEVYKGYNRSSMKLIKKYYAEKAIKYNFDDNKTIYYRMIAYDEFGNFNSTNFTIKTNVDYAPEFRFLDIPNKLNKDNTELKVDIYDCKDDDINVSWLVDGNLVCKDLRYTPNLDPGEYNITVVASDGNHTIRSSKTIQVEDDENVQSNFPWIWIVLTAGILFITGGSGVYLFKNRTKDDEISEKHPSKGEVEFDKAEVTKSVYRELNKASLDEAYEYLKEEKGIPIDFEDFRQETIKLVEQEIIGIQYRGMDDKIYIWL